MKIAITAASGQLGAAITKATAELIGPENTIALARSPEKALHLGVEVRKADYNHQVDFEAALADVTAVLLVSANGDPAGRVPQHRNVINGAKVAGVEKIVYTSVQGQEEGNSFSPVIQSNRQTERDIAESGLDFVIGRNGIYIEPDIEYIDEYKKLGKIVNCAGDGRCGYTTRDELGYAYARLLSEGKHRGQTYNLHGEPITQARLAELLNLGFGTNLVYESMTPEEYQADRAAELGEFLGTIIAGIYTGIRNGGADNPSHFEQAAGRPHVGWEEYFKRLP